jgi:hypothetical protein
MKKIFFIFAILLFAVLLANCSQSTPAMRQQMLGAASLSMQITPLPPTPVEDKSEIGSTNGILIMGVVIVGISILPLIIYGRKK